MLRRSKSAEAQRDAENFLTGEDLRAPFLCSGNPLKL